MSFVSPSVRRPRIALPAGVAAMIAVLAVGILGVVPATAVPAVPGPGYQDFQYNPGPETSTGGDAVTGSRNQSKLWFNDGKWWGVLFDKNATDPTDAAYRIQSLNMGTQTWTSGGTATRADKRNKSHADVLSDGNTLWMASSHKSGANTPPNGDLQVFKFTYDTTIDTYTLAGGFPKIVAQGGTDAATIAKAPNGQIWVAYTQDDPAPATTAKVRVVNSTTSAGTIWGGPVEIPGGTGPITTNDLAAITNINGGVGVFWSNQNALDHAFYFSAHPDGGAWGARETAYNPAGGADGHMSVKTNSNGDVLAAVKTNQSGANPLIGVLRRTAAGTWESIHTVATSAGSTDPTRPILVIDAENNEADVFMTNQVNGGIITRRTAPLSTLDFGAPGSGTAFIANTADPLINDATSSKQVATVASGIIVLASDRTLANRRYLHGCAGSACPIAPTADFTGTPLSGDGPLNVAFTDASNGTPATWAWTFGDGGTSTLQNPSHTFNPGLWTVSLTVTNALGTNTMTRADYINVSVPPGATYFPIAPIRVLDSRAGLGTNRFNANVAKDFQVTNGTSIPSNATAVTGNLTVTAQTAKGYIILAPTAGSSTSTLNFPVADNRANGVTVALSGTGKLNAVYKAVAGKTAHLLFDVTGYFLGGTSGATYFPIAPIRVLDSRAALGTNRFNANVAKDFQVTNGTSIPSNATAVTGNLTVTAQTAKGYIILAPTAGSSTSTLNFPVADNRANGVTVALSGTGKLNAVYKGVAGKTTHLLFDVTGYFVAGSSGASYFPIAPIRVLDSRAALGTNRFNANVAKDFQVTNGGSIPSTAAAVTGNLTVTAQTAKGYIILAPTAGSSTSTLNFPVADNRANGVTVAVSGTGKLNAVYKAVAGKTTHLLFDVTGYFD